MVFWLIRGNGNECNFDEIGYGKAKCSQGYLLVTPRMKILTPPHMWEYLVVIGGGGISDMVEGVFQTWWSGYFRHGGAGISDMVEGVFQT